MTADRHQREENRKQVLRRKAEARIEERGVGAELSGMDRRDLEALIYELNVHQVELDVQNEELREVQGQLIEARDRYRDLYEFAPVGYLTLDGEGVVQEANLETSRLSGLVRDRIIGRRLERIVLQPDRDTCYLLLRRLFDGRETAAAEFRLDRPDGKLTRVRAEASSEGAEPGDADRYRVVLTDVTSRTQAEARLRHNALIFRRLAESDLLGVSLGDTQGNVFYANDELLRMMGYTRDQLEAGRINWIDTIPSEHRGEVVAGNKRLLRDGQLSGYEREFLRPDGERTRYLGAAARVSPESEIHVSIALDVTEMRANQEKLRQSHERLEQRVAERTAALEEKSEQLRRLVFELSETEDRERRRLADLLHDELQQILVGAKLSLEAGLERVDEPKIAQLIGTAQRSLERAMHLGRHLSHELSPPHPMEEDLRMCLEWLAQMMREAHGLEVTLQMPQAPDDVPESIVGMSYSAVRELLLNVVKHAKTGNATVEVDWTEGRLELTVRDRGRGFEANTLHETDTPGFGLRSIRERVQVIGGTLRIVSRPGEGCRVDLSLPVPR